MSELVDALLRIASVVTPAVLIAVWIVREVRGATEQATRAADSTAAARRSIDRVDLKLDRLTDRISTAEQRIAVLEDRTRRAA